MSNICAEPSGDLLPGILTPRDRKIALAGLRNRSFVYEKGRETFDRLFTYHDVRFLLDEIQRLGSQLETATNVIQSLR